MFDPQGPTLLELARQALSSTTRGYDLLADKFEHTPFRTPDALIAPVIEIIGADGPVRRALDACCGTGALMRALRPVCTESVTGIDLSQGMLDEAARLLAHAPGAADVELLQQDVLSMDFVEAFDVVTCAGAFGHILHHQQDAFAEAVARALVPGGRFVFITHLMPTPGSWPWLAARGFNAVMHMRNALIDPPFIMFYLTFPLERAADVLGRHGFELRVHAPYDDPQYGRSMRVVEAIKR